MDEMRTNLGCDFELHTGRKDAVDVRNQICVENDDLNDDVFDVD